MQFIGTKCYNELRRVILMLMLVLLLRRIQRIQISQSTNQTNQPSLAPSASKRCTICTIINVVDVCVIRDRAKKSFRTGIKVNVKNIVEKYVFNLFLKFFGSIQLRLLLKQAYDHFYVLMLWMSSGQFSFPFLFLLAPSR